MASTLEANNQLCIQTILADYGKEKHAMRQNYYGYQLLTNAV
jgi:hypothetical protein